MYGILDDDHEIYLGILCMLQNVASNEYMYIYRIYKLLPKSYQLHYIYSLGGIDEPGTAYSTLIPP